MHQTTYQLYLSFLVLPKMLLLLSPVYFMYICQFDHITTNRCFLQYQYSPLFKTSDQSHQSQIGFLGVSITAGQVNQQIVFINPKQAKSRIHIILIKVHLLSSNQHHPQKLNNMDGKRIDKILKLCLKISSYYIIIFQFEKKSKMTTKRFWTQQEDQFLRSSVKKNQSKNWVEISKEFNQKYQGQPKTAKQCRQRYINHASKSEQSAFENLWDLSQQHLLFQLYENQGPKWTLIAKKFHNKSQNNVKNKFYCSLRKFVRKLNKFLRSGKNKYKKQIKYDSIIRVMEAHETFLDLQPDLKEESLSIRKKILNSTLKLIECKDIQDEQLVNMADNINKFNLKTRSYKAKKPKWNGNQKSQEVSQDSFAKQNKKDHQQKQKDTIMREQNEKQNIFGFNQMGLRQENKDFVVQKSNKSASFISQQEIFEDFGVILDDSDKKVEQKQSDILKQMFPDAFLKFQIQECEF